MVQTSEAVLRPDPSPLHSVYLLCAENGRFKIGRSASLEYRLSSITMSPIPIMCVHVIHTHTGVLLEQYLHHMLLAFRVHGEWFELPPEIVDTIKSVDVLEVRKTNGDWLNFVKRLTGHLAPDQKEPLDMSRTDYIAPSEAAAVVGTCERTIQLWIRPYKDQRTNAGYPVALMAKVAQQHGANVTEEDLYFRRSSDLPARTHWSSQTAETSIPPIVGQSEGDQRIERLVAAANTQSQRLESLMREQAALMQTMVDYLSRIDALLSDRRSASQMVEAFDAFRAVLLGKEG